MNHTKRDVITQYPVVIFLLAGWVLMASGPAKAGDYPSHPVQKPAQPIVLDTFYDENDPAGSDLESLQVEGGEGEEESLAVCVPDIPGMVGYWPLDDQDPGGTKITFKNPLGANDGTCTKPGCPTREPAGKVKGAYTFNPSPDSPDKIDVPKFPALDWTVSDSFSFETWVKMAPTVNCTGRQVFVSRRGLVGTPVFSIWLGCEEGTNTAMFSARDSTAKIFDVQGKKAITDGGWHHLVGVRDAAAKKLNLFVDGVLEGSVNTSYQSGFVTGKDLSIGYLNTGFNPYYYLNGTLDEVAVYKKALTLTDVKAHYNGGAGKSYCGGTATASKVYIPIAIR